MFIRAELKTNAKKILKRNYWWIVLVALILGIVSGSGTGINFRYNPFTGDSTASSYEGILGEKDPDDIWGDIRNNQYQARSFEDFYRIYTQQYERIYHQIETYIRTKPPVVLITLACVVLIAFLLALAVSVFLLNPLLVGCRRWLILNRKEKPAMDEIAYAFKNGYGNTVLAMFCRRLFIFLWSLLFLIPGIIKSYEYRMVPYLLAENPKMSRKEAFKISKNLMDGNKWAVFVLDLSFIGWAILSVFTFGILNVFYVSPYIALTETELYVCLCQGQERYSMENRAQESATDNLQMY